MVTDVEGGTSTVSRSAPSIATLLIAATLK